MEEGDGPRPVKERGSVRRQGEDKPQGITDQKPGRGESYRDSEDKQIEETSEEEVARENEGRPIRARKPVRRYIEGI